MLEWTLLIELILLGILLIAGGIGFIVSKSNPHDPFAIFVGSFWRTFLWPPVPMEIDDPPSSRPLAPLPPREPSAEMTDEDAMYGRIKRDRDGRINTATLELLVIPNSAADQVVGAEGGGLKIQVTGEPGDGHTNKALIDLVSNAIGVKPYQVTITKGHYHARKTVTIQGMRPEELGEKISGLG